MRPRKSKIVLIISVLMLASVACRLFSSDSLTPTPEVRLASATVTQESPEVTATEPSPTTTAESTASSETPDLTLPTLPPAQPGPETLELEPLLEDHGLPDFSETISLALEWTDPVDGLQQSETEYTNRQQSVPDTAWSLLFDDNNPFFPTLIENAVIGGQGFSSSSDTGCQVVEIGMFESEDQRQPFRDLLGALTGQAARSEEEILVGELVVDAYILEASNFKPGAEVVLEASIADSSGEFSSTTSSTISLTQEGDILESGMLYLARQGGFPARIELVHTRTAGDEDAPFAEPGSMMKRTLVYEVRPATLQDSSISPPAGCEGMADEAAPSSDAISISDLPRMDDASNVIQTGDSLIYQTNYSLGEVLEFYSSTLTAQGWEKTDEIILGTLATLEMSLGDQILSITLTQSGDNVLATILLE